MDHPCDLPGRTQRCVSTIPAQEYATPTVRRQSDASIRIKMLQDLARTLHILRQKQFRAAMPVDMNAFCSRSPALAYVQESAQSWLHQATCAGAAAMPTSHTLPE
eukprot:TRINITY_DN24108_c0_g1_i1.p3 TRINITY_DN24108_c0_g1~~TRINITY_DN24108_c0_g1_i1.p3  ORF type:complete len:105 (+),score=0.43 TRINITY_DN24108_c0_g1_i1:729-1043(+)